MYFLAEGSASSLHPMMSTLPKHVDGRKTLLFPERGIAKWFYESGIAEKNVIEWAGRTFGHPDKIFLDIGAHVGTYAWSIAPKFKHTYAFECNPKVFCYLAANIALHDLTDTITPIHVGLGDKPGRLPLIVRSEDGGGNGVKKLTDGDVGGKEVEIRTLDSYGLINIGFIKIDVEGFEKEVLLGARETLKASGYPPILFESWGQWKEKEGVPAMQIRTDLFETFIELGYRLEPVDGAQDTFLATYSISASISD